MPSYAELLEQLHMPPPKLRARMYEAHRALAPDRDLLVYAMGMPNPIPGIPQVLASIQPDDVQMFMGALTGLHSDKLDLILHSGGGSSEAAEQIVNYLRAKYKNIRVFVPLRAMSAATMISCAADVIIMGRESAIGPTDPQINLPNSISVPAQAILDDYKKAKEEIAQNPTNAALWGPKFNALPHGFLSYCQSTIDRSKKLVCRWLHIYMGLEEEKADEISTWLATGTEHLSHGRPISFEQARDKGLKVELLEAHQDLQDAILSIFHSVILTFQHTNIVKIVENHNTKGVQVQVNIAVAPQGVPVVPQPRHTPQPPAETSPPGLSDLTDCPSALPQTLVVEKIENK